MTVTIKFTIRSQSFKNEASNNIYNNSHNRNDILQKLIIDIILIPHITIKYFIIWINISKCHFFIVKIGLC
jgi:hypothetical protein